MQPGSGSGPGVTKPESDVEDVVALEKRLVRLDSLRSKLGDDPRSPKRIKTVRGIGYVLAKEEEQ